MNHILGRRRARGTYGAPRVPVPTAVPGGPRTAPERTLSTSFMCKLLIHLRDKCGWRGSSPELQSSLESYRSYSGISSGRGRNHRPQRAGCLGPRRTRPQDPSTSFREVGLTVFVSFIQEVAGPPIFRLQSHSPPGRGGFRREEPNIWDRGGAQECTNRETHRHRSRGGDIPVVSRT